MSELIKVPDLGSGAGTVIELLVKVGEHISAEQSLLTLESDKASMEIPAPYAGVIKKLLVKLGDSLKEGDPILEIEPETTKQDQSNNANPESEPQATVSSPAPAVEVAVEASPSSNVRAPSLEQIAPLVEMPKAERSKVHAGPAVRLLAREFGVDLHKVSGSGPKQRILKEDLQNYVRQRLAQPESAATGLPSIPAIDFSRFGEIEEVPLTRLMQIAANNLQRSWLNVPLVTQFDQADISELEAFRLEHNAANADDKLTVLPFLLKACAQVLKEMPDFNSSLAPSGTSLIRKKYIHLGFAVDTPEGLLVPVIRDVEKKNLLQLAHEAADLAQKARSKKLSVEAMQGACFTLSSLGHIGGTGFTPIVNAPEVAILGISRASQQPVWDGQGFVPRLMLPLSLSYDHRVVNGAAAAQFCKRLGQLLGDIRRLLL